MKLLIAGSRSITSVDLSPYVPAGVDTIISGGAAGTSGCGPSRTPAPTMHFRRRGR